MSETSAIPTHSIENQHLRLEFLAKGGPRLLRLFLAGSAENQMAELPETASQETPFGTFYFRGGHRLWHAPEAMPRTYIPDNEGQVVTETPDGVVLTGPVEVATGIRKSIEIELHAGRPALTLNHRLENAGLWPVSLAAWALTQLPLGGVAVFPQQVGALDDTGLLPNRNLTLWPYSQWKDGRLELGDDFVLLHAQAQLPPFKLGYLNRTGWAGYLRQGVFLVKRIQPLPDQPHVDFGCNVESYCNHVFIELETLSPLVTLEPGQSVTHQEIWEFTLGVEEPQTMAGIRALTARLGLV